MAPLIVGWEFIDVVEINSALSQYKGNPFAKSVIEVAWWTLASKMQGKPLHELLGGTYHQIAVGADFGVQDSIDTLLGLIDGAVANQMPRIKLKAMPGWDLDMLKAVTSTFPHQVFHIDCNSCYSLDDLPLFREIDKLGSSTMILSTMLSYRHKWIHPFVSMSPSLRPMSPGRPSKVALAAILI